MTFIDNLVKNIPRKLFGVSITSRWFQAGMPVLMLLTTVWMWLDLEKLEAGAIERTTVMFWIPPFYSAFGKNGAIIAMIGICSLVMSIFYVAAKQIDKEQKMANQQVDPTVKTPVD